VIRPDSACQARRVLNGHSAEELVEYLEDQSGQPWPLDWPCPPFGGRPMRWWRRRASARPSQDRGL